MKLAVEQLTKNDYDILEYVNRFDLLPLSQIVEHFDGKLDAVEYRLYALSLGEYTNDRCFIANSSYIYELVEYNNDDDTRKYSYHITDLGKKTLQDYYCRTKAHTKELWLTNAKIPILVSFLTTLIANYILPKLPQIARLLYDFLCTILSSP